MKLGSVIKRPVLIGAGAVVGGVVLTCGIYFGVLQPKHANDLVHKYKTEIESVEIPKDTEVAVSEKGDFDKEELEHQKHSLESAKKELESIASEIDKEDFGGLLIRQDYKKDLLNYTDHKIGEVDEGLEAVAEVPATAKKRAVSYKKSHEKETAKKETGSKEGQEKESVNKKTPENKVPETKDVAVSETASSEAKHKDLGSHTVVGNKGVTKSSEAPSKAPSNKEPVTSTKESSSKRTTGGSKEVATKTTPKKETERPVSQQPKKPVQKPVETKPASDPKPAYGSVSRKNMNASGQWRWEHGEYYYIWDAANNSWSTYFQPGSDVTDRARWEAAAAKHNTKPSKPGKFDGQKAGQGTMWIYFGGKF